ncbi:hypothetical protein [Microbacterium terricola]|uniref:Uncharacterized protein n=1 Tax=Microbacterium terricola TaxID=344163 RepID=A0ABM8DYQ5_9MICO|nr:hypothetical protein [Microbacterium terricola]UYK41424.1 hypothetical protein OAU46_07295 [Microbacterium terricola]BDV30787.1 hypothetical protein Microterr_14470 [Microbacterium terricola]
MAQLTVRFDSNEAPVVTGGRPVTLAAAGPQLWRVIDSAQRVLGHIQRAPGPSGARYRARRFHSGVRAFIELGEFWSADDAVDCLRYAR